MKNMVACGSELTKGTNLMFRQSSGHRLHFIYQHVVLLWIVCVMMGGFVLVPSSSASAWVATCGTWSSSTIFVKNQGSTTTYNGVTHNYGTLWSQAVARWNAANLDAMWVVTPYTSQLRMYNTNRGADGYVGLSGWSCTGSTINSGAWSSGNEYYLWDESDAQIPGLMIHELGHTAGLHHPSSCLPNGLPAIMKSSFGCGYFYPQTDDKNGINALY